MIEKIGLHSQSCSMSDVSSTNAWAPRWDALLAENSVLEREHLDLLSSFTPPFSRQQIAQLEASATRRSNLVRKMRELVDEWTKGCATDRKGIE